MGKRWIVEWLFDYIYKDIYIFYNIDNETITQHFQM